MPFDLKLVELSKCGLESNFFQIISSSSLGNLNIKSSEKTPQHQSTGRLQVLCIGQIDQKAYIFKRDFSLYIVYFLVLNLSELTHVFPTPAEEPDSSQIPGRQTGTLEGPETSP